MAYFPTIAIGVPFFRGGGFSAEYSAILARATALGYTLPTAAVQILQNTLVKALIDSGVWAKLDHLKIYAGSNSDFSLLNWISPTTFLSTKVNSPTYGYAYGWAGNATTAHLQTNFTPSGLLNYKQNDSCYFRYKKTDRTVGQLQNYMGSYEATKSTYIGSYSGNVYAIAINGIEVIPTIGIGDLGLQLLNRNNSANFNLWQSGVNLGTIISPSVGIPINQFLTCKISVTNASNAEISCEGAGAALTNGQIATLTTAFNTYLASI
jgi:hypothetical protein